MPAGSQPAKRQRKSRFGCKNCKLRKLKCDETKPQCLRCRQYGVVCNFGLTNVSDLQPLSEQRSKPQAAKQYKLPVARSISNGVWIADGTERFELDLQDQALFTRFRHRTLVALNPDMVGLYESHLYRVSLSCRFMMHGMLAVAAVHDRYVDTAPTKHRTLKESYHWSQCTSLFNKWLSQPLQEDHKDPIWATAGMLGILAFASMNASSYGDAWPLKPPDSSDLEWTRLGNAKMTLWHIVNPLRPDSIFRIMSDTFRKMREPLPGKGRENIPDDLAELCGITDSSTKETNPYFEVAHGVSWLQKKDNITLGTAMMVMGHMHNEFEVALRDRDPVAMLLLCLWYTKARHTVWWINFRARYELPAICTYLRLHHQHDAELQALIPWDEARILM
ncbi:hypothetical protein F5Y18DRAFT_196414 [Xylariaceae sp. FL1019]|nr:hypothetical protein F5Y18DRAFT_196414 [Xylariaceae sp. FL1019]